MTDGRAEDLARSVEAAEALLSVAGTMKALSASRIRRFREAAESLRGYRATLELALQVALRADLPEGPSPRAPGVSSPPVDGPMGLVVFGSDLGLAGPYNARIAEFALARLEELRADPGEALVLAVGARVGALLESLGLPAGETLRMPESADAIGASAREVVVRLGAWRTRRGCEEMHLVHNVIGRGVDYRPTSLRLLPLDESWLQDVRSRPWPTRIRPTTRTPWPALLPHLVRELMFARVVGALAESMAAEHASRMVAMEVAERRIEERLADLRGRAHLERQERITEELQEISTGFEALRGEER